MTFASTSPLHRKVEPVLLAAVGHALDFEAWCSVVRQQGLDDEQAVEVMVGMVRGARLTASGPRSR